MNVLPKKSVGFTLLFIVFISAYLPAQTQNLQLTQDQKIERLLSEKRKINPSLTLTDKYKIQVYSGENELAKKTLIEFRKEFKNLDATIVFNTPSYKVWAGNFKSRIEVEKALVDIKKKYPNALVVKPNK